MKRQLIFDQRPDEWHEDRSGNLTRDDLDPDEQIIYDNTLTRLASPSAEQLHMLSAYSWAASELKKSTLGNDQALTLWLRKCMIYARNGLGIAKPIFVDGMELILEYIEGISSPSLSDWPPIFIALNRTWQENYGQK